MNTTEARMLEMLKKGRDDFGVVAIKAEFEAEGTRPDELLRLIDLTRRAGLDLALKIGGCEAISDLYAARLYGADHVIAPMVESVYALSKFADACDKVFGADAGHTHFLFNLETESTGERLASMIPLAAERLDGVVFGRVDYTLSRGMPRDAVNARAITTAVLEAAQHCRENDLELVVGGSISNLAGDVLREVRQVRLDRFETRKVIFDGAVAESLAFDKAIANAVAFELAWLENKRDYYQAIAQEDGARIAMMRQRAGGAVPHIVRPIAAA